MNTMTEEGMKAYEKLGFQVTQKKTNGDKIVYAKKGNFRHTWLNGTYLETCIKVKGKWTAYLATIHRGMLQEEVA